MEIVYEIKAVEDTVDVETAERIAGIDIGVNNLARDVYKRQIFVSISPLFVLLLA